MKMRLGGSTDRERFCSIYGDAKSFDMGALMCESAWDHNASPDKLCELIIKAVKLDNKCTVSKDDMTPALKNSGEKK